MIRLALFLTVVGSKALAGTIDWRTHISTNCFTGQEQVSAGPVLRVFGEKRKLLTDGDRVPKKFVIEVRSNKGIDSLEVTRGAPLIDSERNLGNGCASYIFTDPTTYPSSATYRVKVEGVKDGTPIFVQAFDGSGGVTIRGFFLGGTNSKKGVRPNHTQERTATDEE